ncbi:MAG: hypothetical protein GC162_01170 [Planctomycetes bacterium]|nr:hypothetical protein [Planctomycetota bacterium]
MQLQRISAKFYLADPRSLDLAKITPVFHRWIRAAAVEGMLIDVATYAHLPDGPGIVLVGHEGDYAIDMSEGRPGFRYERKRDRAESVRDQLRLVLRLALIGAAKMIDDHDPHGPVPIRSDEALITISDRLRAPNTDAAFKTLRSDIEAVLSEIYGETHVMIQREAGEPSAPLRIRVSAPKALSIAALASATVS